MLLHRKFSFLFSRRFLLFFLISLFLLFGSGYFFLFRPLRAGALILAQTWPHWQKLKKNLRQQNLQELNQELIFLQQQREKLEESWEKLSFLRYWPRLGIYYQDAGHLLRAADYGLTAGIKISRSLEPWAPLLGQGGGKKVKMPEKIAQWARLAPELDQSLAASEDLILRAGEELQQIHPALYPQQIRGIALRSELEFLQQQAQQLPQSWSELRRFLPLLPELLGVDGRRTYLLLFQNDKELRPTGGFLTAYALVSFDDGYFRLREADDIYKLDPKISLLPPPPAITLYLKQKGWWMRDTNFAPDFKESMENFLVYYQQTSAPPVDGIIALDTQFVAAALELSGPLKLPGYEVDPGQFWNIPSSCLEGGDAFTATNVVCRLELYAEKVFRRHPQRKAILGDLMEALLDWVFNSPPAQWPQLLELLQKQAEEKHLLFYFTHPQLQQLVEDHNWGGRIKETLQGQDYLHFNQANLAGLKSDLYLQRRLNYAIELTAAESVVINLELELYNSGAYDGWLNSTARNYLRFYIPAGSKLLQWQGDVAQVPRLSAEGDKAVIETFVLTPPLAKSKLQLRYQLPWGREELGSRYCFWWQKQPGMEKIDYQIKLQGQIVAAGELRQDQNWCWEIKN